jgi:integrase
LLSKRRGEALTNTKLPETLRTRAILFSEVADDAISYVNGCYARPADDVSRLELLKTKFTGRADAVTAGQIESALDKLVTEKKWSPSTRNHHHNLLSLSYRLAILHGKVNDSPLRGLRRKPENNSRVRFLTPEEEKKLRTAVRSNPTWAPHEPEIDLGLATGLRRSSMYLNLVWENVDEQGRTLTIPRTKNDDPITLPLNQDAMRALAVFRSRGDGNGRVVRNISGKTLSFNADWFVPAVRAAGIKNFHWHDLRHTFASRLRQKGVPLANIAELLGHKGLLMTKRYAHLGISNLHDAVSLISNSPESNSTPVAPALILATPQVAHVQQTL